MELYRGGCNNYCVRLKIGLGYYNAMVDMDQSLSGLKVGRSSPVMVRV